MSLAGSGNELVDDKLYTLTTTAFGCATAILTGILYVNFVGVIFVYDNDEFVLPEATAGTVLGKFKEFNQKYGKYINNARCKNACGLIIKRGEQANKELQEILKPIILRRKKVDYLKKELPPKEDICVLSDSWLSSCVGGLSVAFSMVKLQI